MSKSWAWLFLCLSSIACARSILMPASQCVWHAGDNPAWAASDLDQSGWKPYSEWNFSFDQPRLWIRCKADLAALSGLSDPAIQVSAPAAYEVFSRWSIRRLVLMTDGIVEAQSPAGELFGFDRIGQLMRSGADGAALATAAQQYGQEDDITVLTLTFAPAEVLHA